MTTLDSVTRAWAVVTSAGVVRLGLGFVASLLIARGLGSAGFGAYAVLAATVAIVGSLAEGGLTEAAVLRMSAAWQRAHGPSAGFDEPSSATRGQNFFWLRLGFAALVVATACLLAEPLAPALLNVDAGLTRWALLGIVATAAGGAVSAMLQAIGAFARMSSLTLLNTALTALLAAVLLLVGHLDLLTALVVLGIGTSLATFLVGRTLLPAGWSLRPPGGAELIHEGRRLLRTGRWLWLASVFAMLAANSEVLLLNQWASLPLVGAYGLALNLATKADVVNHSLYTVLLPGVSTLRAPHVLTSYVRRGLLRSGLIALGLLLLIPLAQPFIAVLYGVDFAPAAVLFQLLLGVMIFDVLLTPVLLLPLAYQQPRLLAAGDALRAVTLIGVGLLLIPSLGAPGAIAARFASRVAGAVLVLGALWRGRATLEVEHEEATAVAQHWPAT